MDQNNKTDSSSAEATHAQPQALTHEAAGHVHGPNCSHGHGHHHHHASHDPIVRSEAKVGRNDPCPCGSQQKFKKCHGK